MIIRFGTSKEAEEISALDASRFHVPYSENAFKNSFRTLSEKIIVAEEGGSIVGFLMYAEASDEAEIYRLAVKKESEGQGIGSSLMTQGLENMRKDGLVTCFLEVRASNKLALGLYKKFGFVSYRVRKAYYSDGEDAVCMKKGLAI